MHVVKEDFNACIDFVDASKVWDIDQVEEAYMLQSSGPNLGNLYALLCEWIYLEFQVFMGCKFMELFHLFNVMICIL